jgi:hypothetical protein
MKGRVLDGEALELIAIIKVLFTPSAEKQPELMPEMPFTIREKPVQHRTEKGRYQFRLR